MCFGDKFPTFADETLSDQSPEHVGAMMAVSGLVKGFLAEKVPLLDHFWGPFGGGAGRACTRPRGHIAVRQPVEIPKSHVFR